MKVGVISKGSPDYLIDIVTDGLIRLLGRANVSVDYNVRFEPDGNGPYQHLCRGLQGPEPFDLNDAEVLIASVRSLAAAQKWKSRTGRSKIALIDRGLWSPAAGVRGQVKGPNAGVHSNAPASPGL